MIGTKEAAEAACFWCKSVHPRKRTNVPQKGTISIGNASSNHHFSVDMLVFKGVMFF